MPYPYVIKTLMPNYREFDDTRHFFSLQKLARELGTTPNHLISPVSLKIRDTRYSIGCLLCEDGWSDNYELQPFEVLRQNNPIDFFVNISASPYTLGKTRNETAFSDVRQKLRLPPCSTSTLSVCKTTERPSIPSMVPVQHTQKTEPSMPSAQSIRKIWPSCLLTAKTSVLPLHRRSRRLLIFIAPFITESGVFLKISI